jgi:hypothetical protein
MDSSLVVGFLSGIAGLAIAVMVLGPDSPKKKKKDGRQEEPRPPKVERMQEDLQLPEQTQYLPIADLPQGPPPRSFYTRENAWVPGMRMGVMVPDGMIRDSYPFPLGATPFPIPPESGIVNTYAPNLPPASFRRPFPFVNSLDLGLVGPHPGLDGLPVVGLGAKVGILSLVGTRPPGAKNEILNLFARPIAPVDDQYEFRVQDRDGFVINLDQRYLEDKQVITGITGKPGEWLVTLDSPYTFVWR